MEIPHDRLRCVPPEMLRQSILHRVGTLEPGCEDGKTAWRFGLTSRWSTYSPSRWSSAQKWSVGLSFWTRTWNGVTGQFDFSTPCGVLSMYSQS